MANIGAVILAAGGSARFGEPKQLLQFHRKSLVQRIADSAEEAGCQPIVVVLGSAVTALRQAINNSRVIFAENEEWQLGIGSSIRSGVQCLIDHASKVDAILLLVCDQPSVDTHVIGELIALRKKTNKPIIASSYADTLGVPALFDRSCFADLLSLSDEHGAKSIIQRNPERIAQFPFPGGQIDIDTYDDWKRVITGRGN